VSSTDPGGRADRPQRPAAPSWLDTPSHRQWLTSGFARIIRSAIPSIRPEGGFHQLDANGLPMPDRRPQLFLTARMVYIAAHGVEEGVPGAGSLVDHGIDALFELHADGVHGGWISDPEAEGEPGRKSTYDHVHVGLAAANTARIDHPRSAELLDRAIEVFETRLWDDDTGTLRESFAADWSDSERYRGANANMHGVEAMLAIGHTTGDPIWHQRGLAVADRLVNNAARNHGWLQPEHYTPDWEPLLDYNADQPLHPFRPPGATFGHSLEWARFLLELHWSPMVDSTPWLTEAAEALATRALDGGWALDGRPGLVYTVDWAGTPVADVHLHWPICEGIMATAALYRQTGNPHWEQWYRRLWDHAERWFVDDRGTWRNELNHDMSEGSQLWPGRPDVYHCGGAYLGPLRM
jgi:mannose/cellobiose epimerase-like protein (N-acyl-D-glucosamine 2-epimerase family)